MTMKKIIAIIIAGILLSSSVFFYLFTMILNLDILLERQQV